MRTKNHAIEADAKLTEKVNQEYEAARHKAQNGKMCRTAHAWKFNSLLYKWKEAHPFGG